MLELGSCMSSKVLRGGGRTFQRCDIVGGSQAGGGGGRGPETRQSRDLNQGPQVTSSPLHDEPGYRWHKARETKNPMGAETFDILGPNNLLPPKLFIFVFSHSDRKPHSVTSNVTHTTGSLQSETIHYLLQVTRVKSWNVLLHRENHNLRTDGNAALIIIHCVQALNIILCVTKNMLYKN